MDPASSFAAPFISSSALPLVAAAAAAACSAPLLSIDAPLAAASSATLTAHAHVSDSPISMEIAAPVGPSSSSPAKRARHSVNLLTVGTAALRRELEAREIAEATAASLAEHAHSSLKNGRKRASGAEAAEAAAAAAGPASSSSCAAAAIAQPAAAMVDVWADEQPMQPLQPHHQQQQHVDLTQADDEPAAQSQPELFAEGQAVPVAQLHHHTHTFAGAFPSFTQPAHRSGPPPSNAAVVRDFFRHYSSNRGGGGRRGGRPIRTPHAMPAMHQMETEHLPSMQQRGMQLNHMQQMPPMPQLDAIFNAAPPQHGHPPSFNSAAAAAANSEDIVDLTQEGGAAAAAAASGDSDVQVISHTQGAGEFVGYNAFNPAFSQAPAYDAYAAAFARATSSSSYSAPPTPSEPVPLSTDQFASLSKEQQAVVLAIQRGKNVFFSGCAGTGKSHLLKLLTQFLPKRSTFFTASTGLAAVNIGGSTLHSFAGIGLGEGDPVKLAARAAGNRRARERWLDCQVLVIDEISMISGQLFDKLELVARTVRKNQQPFGGVQLVLSGDFLQLPPVKATKPTFRADSWERCIDLRIVLTKVFRQQGDPTFINLLSNLRYGTLTLKDECILKKSHYTALPPVEGVLPTKLNPLKKDTAEENGKFLAALPEPPVVFKAHDSGESDAHLQLLKKDCPAIDELHLKVGAQVMLLKNLDPAIGLCNGSRGIIIDFVKLHMENGGAHQEGSDEDEPSPHPVARSATKQRIEMDENGCVLISGPTTVGGAAAAASSSNGTTPSVSTSATPAPAAAAAAAVTINSTPFYADESKGMFGGRVRSGNSEEVYLLPRVRFENGVVQVIESDKFELQVQDKVMARRQQVPLTLAWALTIHKSQGMTLDRAEINAQGMFENGQLYVAVSRVKSIPGLRLRGFTRDTMRTDMSVVEWYKKLERETEVSTRELLKDVDKEYPQLKAVMEAQKIKRKEEEEQEKKDKAAGGAAAAAASSSAAAAGSGSLPPAPIVAASASPSFVSASKLFGVPVKLEKPPISPIAGFRAASAALKQEAGAGVAVKAEAPPVGWVGPPPKAFRSPLKDPAAAAASNAAAQAELSSVNQSRNICCVCQTDRATHIVLDCMHMCLCDECKDNFRAPRTDTSPPGIAKQCPVCRAKIKDVRKVFSS